MSGDVYITILSFVFLFVLAFSFFCAYDKKTGVFMRISQIGGVAYLFYSCYNSLLYVAISFMADFKKARAYEVLTRTGVLDLALRIAFLVISGVLTVFLWKHVCLLKSEIVRVIGELMLLALLILICLDRWIMLQCVSVVLFLFLLAVGLVMEHLQSRMEKQLRVKEQLSRINEANQKELDDIRDMLSDYYTRAVENDHTESAEYLRSMIERMDER